jgi:hypothetical protein
VLGFMQKINLKKKDKNLLFLMYYTSLRELLCKGLKIVC